MDLRIRRHYPPSPDWFAPPLLPSFPPDPSTTKIRKFNFVFAKSSSHCQDRWNYILISYLLGRQIFWAWTIAKSEPHVQSFSFCAHNQQTKIIFTIPLARSKLNVLFCCIENDLYKVATDISNAHFWVSTHSKPPCILMFPEAQLLFAFLHIYVS